MKTTVDRLTDYLNQHETESTDEYTLIHEALTELLARDKTIINITNANSCINVENEKITTEVENLIEDMNNLEKNVLKLLRKL